MQWEHRSAAAGPRLKRADIIQSVRTMDLTLSVGEGTVHWLYAGEYQQINVLKGHLGHVFFMVKNENILRFSFKGALGVVDG